MSNNRNFIASVVGTTGSGKSYLLNQFAQRFPRRLVLDFMGEHTGRIAGARECYDLRDTVAALSVAARQSDRWTVLSFMDERFVPDLFRVLAPTGRDAARGFSRTVGGLVVECGEVDLIAPNSGAISDGVKSLYKRGRHAAISILGATQRASECHRIVTSQSTVICAFRQHEPRDVATLAQVMGSRAGDMLPTLAPRHYLRYWPAFGTLELVDPFGKCVAVDR